MLSRKAMQLRDVTLIFDVRISDVPVDGSGFWQTATSTRTSYSNDDRTTCCYYRHILQSFIIN